MLREAESVTRSSGGGGGGGGSDGSEDASGICVPCKRMCLLHSVSRSWPTFYQIIRQLVCILCKGERGGRRRRRRGREREEAEGISHSHTWRQVQLTYALESDDALKAASEREGRGKKIYSAKSNNICNTRQIGRSREEIEVRSQCKKYKSNLFFSFLCFS